jgi:hypothetical protein
VGALFTGVLTAAFFDAPLATAVFFVAITTLYPIFFVGCDATNATGRRLKHDNQVRGAVLNLGERYLVPNSPLDEPDIG